jgi:hypothetical protein
MYKGLSNTSLFKFTWTKWGVGGHYYCYKYHQTSPRRTFLSHLACRLLSRNAAVWSDRAHEWVAYALRKYQCVVCRECLCVCVCVCARVCAYVCD